MPDTNRTGIRSVPATQGAAGNLKRKGNGDIGTISGADGQFSAGNQCLSPAGAGGGHRRRTGGEKPRHPATVCRFI